jgi:3-oxoacyl-[acyl-carrier protein] reductase
MVTMIQRSPPRATTGSVRARAPASSDDVGEIVPEMIVHATLAEFSSIDIIVNNAGYSWDNVIQKTTDEQFQAMLEIHLVTPFRILRAASGFLRESAKREIAASQRVMRKVNHLEFTERSCFALTATGLAMASLLARGASSGNGSEWSAIRQAKELVGQRRNELGGIAALAVELAPVFAGKARAQCSHGGADLRMVVGRR